MSGVDRTVRAELTRHQRTRSTKNGHGSEPGHAAPGVAGEILRLQRTVGNRAVARLIQRHCYDQYNSYEQAKQATPYSQVLLDDQKDDPISLHQRKKFTAEAVDQILEVNKMNSGRDAIVSDNDPSQTLVRQDLAKVPHIDHRYPKSQGGSNSFKNARVLSAAENIKKGAGITEHQSEPRAALPHYAALSDRGHSVVPVGSFNADQKALIYAANERHYGELKSDSPAHGRLKRGDSSEVPHIDHMVPKSDGGCDYYFNAAVLPADENIQKGGVRGAEDDDDWAIGNLTLEQYYAQKVRPQQHAAPGPHRTRQSNRKRRIVDRSNTYGY